MLTDTCCSDAEDDEDAALDDGVFTVLTAKRPFQLTIVYKDADHNGAFSAGDDVRSVTLPVSRVSR